MENEARLEELRQKYSALTGLNRQREFPLSAGKGGVFTDGGVTFDVEIDILIASGVSPKTASDLTGLDVETVKKIYNKEMDYQEMLNVFTSVISDGAAAPPDEFLQVGAFAYLYGTVARAFSMSRNSCDLTVVMAIMGIDRFMSPDTIPGATGLAREAIDAFLNDPTSLSDADKYTLAVKALSLGQMLEKQTAQRQSGYIRAN